MPRRNHAPRHNRARNLTKVKRIGNGLDPLADREERAELVKSWSDKHGPGVRSRWCWHRRTGKNKTPAGELVLCAQCSHHIPHGAAIVTTRWDTDSPVLAFHFRKGAESCWTEFLFHKVRQAAEEALFTTRIQEIA